MQSRCTNKMPEKAKEEFIVKREGQDFEISRFLQFHPGGRNTISRFKNQSIDKKLQEYDHSPAAMYLMKEYKLDNKKNTATEPEDLEKLVDWSKPMKAQVGGLGARYQEWVSAPVDRKLRLFESDFLEMLTLAPWYLIPTVWVPAILLFFYHGYFHQNPNGISMQAVVLTVMVGIFSWSLLEYVLHRWLFHKVPSPDSPEQITFHFTLHGLHHKVPFDNTRLLFPPVPALMIASVVYTLFYLVLPTWTLSLFAAGVSMGYLMYDLTHYYLHYGSPNPGSYLYHMKRYHNRHHFTHQDTGYGISSDFWDRIFGTEISLPKLLHTLKW